MKLMEDNLVSIKVTTSSLKEMRGFLDEIKEGDKILFRDGCLVTQGCSGDYGCCSVRFEVDNFLAFTKEGQVVRQFRRVSRVEIINGVKMWVPREAVNERVRELMSLVTFELDPGVFKLGTRLRLNPRVEGCDWVCGLGGDREKIWVDQDKGEHFKVLVLKAEDQILLTELLESE